MPISGTVAVIRWWLIRMWTGQMWNYMYMYKSRLACQLRQVAQRKRHRCFWLWVRHLCDTCQVKCLGSAWLISVLGIAICARVIVNVFSNTVFIPAFTGTAYAGERTCIAYLYAHTCTRISSSDVLSQRLTMLYINDALKRQRDHSRPLSYNHVLTTREAAWYMILVVFVCLSVCLSVTR